MSQPLDILTILNPTLAGEEHVQPGFLICPLTNIVMIPIKIIYENTKELQGIRFKHNFFFLSTPSIVYASLLNRQWKLIRPKRYLRHGH